MSNFGDFIKSLSPLSWFPKLVGNIFPEHQSEHGFFGSFLNQIGSWFGNGNFGDVLYNGLGSWFDSQTGANLTGSQLQQNAWTEQMDNTKFQRSVADMQAAGLNPALMMSQGATPSVPSGAQGSQGGFSMSELMQTFALKAQIDLTKAQTRKVEADAEGQETENRYKPDVIQANLDKVASEIQKNSAQSDLFKSETDLNADRAVQVRAVTAKIGMEMITERLKQENLQASTENIQAMTKKIAVEKVVLMAQKAMYDSQTRMNDAQTEHINAETRLVNAKSWEQEFQNSFRAEFGAAPGESIWQAATGLALQGANTIGQNIQSAIDSIWNGICSLF